MHFRDKKKIAMMVAIIVAIILFILGVVVATRPFYGSNLYDTDVYGDWWRIVDLGDEGICIQKYTIDTKDKCTGTVIWMLDQDKDIDSMDEYDISVDQINEDVECIHFIGESENEVLYKYKNMMGGFKEVDSIPSGETFDLVLEGESQLMGETASVYKSDGTYHYCWDYGNCINAECGGSVCEYKRHGNVISIKDDDGIWENTWVDRKYIVEDGIFSKMYTKVSNY